jgi:hypothetical protein
MMGNRGVLHDAEGHIHRSWQVRRWLICVLEFHGRHHEVMSPGRYTELFSSTRRPPWPQAIARASSAVVPDTWSGW